MLEHHSRSLAIRRKVLGEDDPQTANASNNVAAALHELGRIREALAEHRRTLAMREKVLGPQHPAVAMSLTNIGSQLYELGEVADGLAATDAALAIARKTMPAKSAVMLGALVNRAGALADLGRWDEAKATYDELFVTLDKDFAKSLRRSRALANRAMLLEVPTGHAREALADAKQAAALATAASSSKTDDVALALLAESSAHEALGDRAAALATAREALAIDEKQFGADGTELLDALDAVGRLGPANEATATLTRALGICEKAGLSGKWLARSRFALARALVRTDRDQAIALANQARDWYATEVDAWLRTR
jgi:serine/threonine-protein kinase